MSETYDLDLDILQPQSRKVRLCGKIVDVYAPKFKNLLNITSAADKLQHGDTQTGLEELRKVLEPLVPALKSDPDIDITMEQMYALVNFIVSMATPEEEIDRKPIGQGQPENEGEKKISEQGQKSSNGTVPQGS